MMRSLIVILVSALLGQPAIAHQDFSPVGSWTIQLVTPDGDFKGWAQVKPSQDGGETYPVELITEDRCCGGNYARVKQASIMTIDGGDIYVDSEIEEFLIREEPVKATFYPDDFDLEWENEATLTGLLNGSTRVEWKRTQNAIS
ncbi:MAG: hypothetical protein AAGH90_12835 [Pseudomonadota bacterium]